MRARGDYLEGLLDLASHTSRNIRRALFRQSVASLALADVMDGPGLLDTLNPDALLRSVRIAMADGLLDDLSWLAPPAAGVALWEIASALPLGPERRDLARRVLAQLYSGNAATFVAIATRMAASSGRGLSGAGIRARVALVMSLPGSAELSVDPLALSIASRRDLSRDWICAASTGSLSDRRLAAQLLERAAREATRRATQGDDLPLRLFRNVGERKRRSAEANADGLALAWRTLLDDRETVVWRHIASARGLLAGVLSDIAEDVRDMVAPDLSPTEWRRGAVSVVANIAVEGEKGLKRAMDLLEGPLPSRDSGVPNAMLWGLYTAAAAEPEAAEELLDAIVATSPINCAEGVAGLRRHFGSASAARGGTFGARAAAQCADALASVAMSAAEADDGMMALARAIQSELSTGGGKSAELREMVEDAVGAFVGGGPRDAHAKAQKAMGLAIEVMNSLEKLEVTDRRGPVSSLSRRAAAELMRTLDADVLEPGTLKSLLLLDRRPTDDQSGVPALDDFDERLAKWLLDVEGTFPLREIAAGREEPGSRASIPMPDPKGETQAPHQVMHLRNLRALLHLIDSETTDFGEEVERKGRVRARWTTTCNLLLERLAAEKASPLRRGIAATVARALDALVRDGVADAADVFLYAAMRAGDPADLEALAEASMHPDVTQLLLAYARFARLPAEEQVPAELTAAPSMLARDPSAHETATREAARVRHALARLSALDWLVTELPAGASQRTEIVRGTLARLSRSLNVIQGAQALSSLVSTITGDASALWLFGDALTRLSQLTTGARRRCGDPGVEGNGSAGGATSGGGAGGGNGGSEPLRLTNAAEPLRLAVEVTLQHPDETIQNFHPSIQVAVNAARRSIPKAIAELIALVLPHIAPLPVRRPVTRDAGPLAEHPLPSWLPSRRIVGGFFVQRSLAGGSQGSVFVVTRAEERHDPQAERFAMKVPAYDHTAARSVSEEEFLRLFGEEAGSLLALPQHPNLPRFVTFDAAARPKPILVMELVEGIRLDKLLDARGLTMRGALTLLDGILAGLQAMHGLGVGHLDVKPTNVILRNGREPVLVDFGLAGRHIRPGCASGNYGAPEVWEGAPEGVMATPMMADIYSFGCVAYEILTGRTLFDGTSDVALIQAHVGHDGLPGPLKKLAGNQRTAEVAAFLFSCLRHNPQSRATATFMRDALGRISGLVADLRWPMDLG
ncbi:serine/threonine-protein kinase [Chondromyces apiculatus]|uniref:Serine/threonine protein kinase n=1 Tax=Chondromyces apiculatus DSM 436 TaxID=1192034 RepID=A0A017TE90_9BACT|nr:serine/threonine-protein kinase [Chondromyces apiculatus]EYF07593.1 serine/threonine protein kinase [Chondromyces apiculatus DSM 436]